MTDTAVAEETKHQKFTRMRDARVPKAVHAIELLGNLSSHHYEWSEEEARAMLDDLNAAVGTVASAFGIEQVTSAGDSLGDDGHDQEHGDALAHDDGDEGIVEPPSGRDPHPNAPLGQLKNVTEAEGNELMRIGRRLDEALEAILAGDGSRAARIITGLTTS